MGVTPVGFEHLHIDHDFSVLDGYGVEEEDERPVDPILQISQAYMKTLEEGRRIQSRTTDNYLRFVFDPSAHILNLKTGDVSLEVEDRVAQKAEQ